MALFDHQHNWHPKTALNKVIEPTSGRATAAIIIEGCSCGEVRQIEYAPGQAPVVRMATHTKS